MLRKQQQAVAVSQPSGSVEQTETTVEVPLTVSAPGKKDKKPAKSKQSKNGNGNAPASDALISGAAFGESLADRIKAGTGRRRTTQQKAHVPSAAVTALAEAVDIALAPQEGATERYLDSRDADHNVPSDIPGVSAEQQQHAATSAGTADLDQQAAGQPAGQGAVGKSKKPRRQKKDSSSNQPAALQPAAQFTQGSGVVTEMLEENEKVSHRRRAGQQVKVEDATQDALAAGLHSNGASSQDASNISSLTDGPAMPPMPKAPKRKRTAKVKAEPEATAQDPLTPVADMIKKNTDADHTLVTASKKQKKQSKAKDQVNPVDAVAAAVDAVAGDESGKKKPKRQRVKATELAVDTETELVEDVPVKGKRSNKKKKEVQADEVDAVVEATEEGANVTVTKKKSRAKAVNKGPIFEMPTRDVLDTALQWEPTARPVPNLGYACLTMALREQKPPIFTNRDMRLATFKQKGLPYVSQLALENVQALKAIIHWNHENGIRFFRMTSTMLPFCTFYDMEDLPDFPAIADELAFAGKLARAYQQRLTFHPSHFVKVAAPKEDLVVKSLKELEVHSQILDLMGYEPSHWNKVNIHIGGVYDDKETTLERFAEGFARLSDNCKARLTLENDDWGSAFSVRDLLPLSHKCNIPIVFDFHHHKFCTGDWSEKEAFFAALETWPKGIRPAVHWSESQDNRKPFAHSDYIYGPMNLHGKEADVDVMIEAKCKERTLLQFRDQTMQGIGRMSQPSFLTEAPANAAAELASKFL